MSVLLEFGRRSIHNPLDRTAWTGRKTSAQLSGSVAANIAAGIAAGLVDFPPGPEHFRPTKTRPHIEWQNATHFITITRIDK